MSRPTVVILGAGMAGLSAAMAAVGDGADVVVIEEASFIGGSMALSGGLVWGQGILRRRAPTSPRGMLVSSESSAMSSPQLGCGSRAWACLWVKRLPA